MSVSDSRPLKAVVLLSDGMDFCVTGAIARQSHRSALIHVSYGQRTEERERRAFDEIADFYDVDDRLTVRLDALRQIGGLALTDQGVAVCQIKGALAGRASRIPVTYVPFRNAHLLSVAVSWAEVFGATAVFGGAVAEDSSGYPDCRPECYRAFAELVRMDTRSETRIEIVTPVIGMRKSEIVRRGMELSTPPHLTWSCYQSEGLGCGVCDSCRLRLRAFAEAGITDPIAYRAAIAQ